MHAQVLDTNCQPVTTALLEMWSANATGAQSRLP